MNIINSLRQTLSIGPVNLPWLFVPIFLAWFLYQFIIKLFYKERYDWLQQVDRIMFNGLFVILVVWKLSPVIFQFSTVRNNPMAVFYLPGGVGGVVLGAAAAVIFSVTAVRKKKDSSKALLKSIGFNFGVLLILVVLAGGITGLIISSLGEQNPESISLNDMQAPDFTLEAEDGLTYTLSDYKGQTVVLNFWASWCPPCRAELPELKVFYDEESSDELVFLSVNLFTSERDPAALPDFIENENLPFPVLYDRAGEVGTAYEIQSIPTTVIIDPDGRISMIKKGAVTNAWLKRAVKP